MQKKILEIILKDNSINKEKIAVILICILFNISYIVEFLISDNVQKLNSKQKKDIFMELSNIYVRDYIKNNEIQKIIDSTKDEKMINWYSEITDVVSYIISFCDQTGSNKDRLDIALEKINKIIDEVRMSAVS